MNKVVANASSEDENIVTALMRLDKASVPYVCWKNSHELEEAIAGGRDVDIFIPVQYRLETLQVLRAHGWCRLNESSVSFPWVEHCFNLESSGKVLHLNIYFKIVTGESHLKEYVLPVDDFLLEQRIRGFSGLWVLSPGGQAHMFFVRHMIKNGSLFSRWLYKRDFSSYAEEWERCAKQPVSPFWEQEVVATQFSVSGLTSCPIKQPRWREAQRTRTLLAPNLRFRRCLLSLHRYRLLLWKFFIRRVLKRKKEAPSEGVVFALSGGDGSGKTSMIGYLEELFGDFMTVKRIHLGRPQSRWVDVVRKIMSHSKPSLGADSTVAPNKPTETVSTKKAIGAVALAFLRLRAAKKAQSWAARGYLVLSDRWPTAQKGWMDGPKLELGNGKGWLTQYLTKLETRIYQRMPRCDVCVMVQVSASTAVERNAVRIKKDKETEEEIRLRHKEAAKFKPLAQDTVYFDNNDSFEVNKNKLAAVIWKSYGALIG